jgi:adenosine deaminase
MDSPERTLAAAQLAARYAGQGVVGFDLAGAERGYPPSLHRAAIDCAKSAGLGLTLHAGEADHGGRVLEAAQLGATRIGHGIRITEAHPERAERLAQAKELGLHFEVCPSSNVHTGAATSLETHPIKTLLQEGLSSSIACDNRLMSGTTLCQELHAVYTLTGLTLTQIIECQKQAIAASFCSENQKAQARAALEKFIVS